jgi:hypothetical protein
VAVLVLQVLVDQAEETEVLVVELVRVETGLRLLQEEQVPLIKDLLAVHLLHGIV